MKKYIDGSKVRNTALSAKTVAQYVVARLVDIGIDHSFTIPGDYAFDLDHAVTENPDLINIQNANELNASYAADGYARVRGAAILCTTYGVGELSAINGVMGAKAENNVIFHLVGMPSSSAAFKHKKVHHTLGDGVFGQFANISASACCVMAVITPDNAIREMNRIIKEAFKYRMPAYISISLDHGNLPVTDTSVEDNSSSLISQQEILSNAIKSVIKTINSASSIVVLPSVRLDRFGVNNLALKLIEKLNVPFAIMPHDKSVLDQTHPNYLGVYAGKMSDHEVDTIVETTDLIIDIGGVLKSDINTAAFSNVRKISNIIRIDDNYIKINDEYYPEVYITDSLSQLIKDAPVKNYSLKLPTKPTPQYKENSLITLNSFYAKLISVINSKHTLVVETGSSGNNMPYLPLPAEVKYHAQSLWGSIGWATPASLGVAIAEPTKRVILVTGEGSHQLTLNEIAIMGRYNLKPIIICINNDGFMVERALEIDPNPSYDDLAQINYTELPHAMGCKNWLAIKARTNKELDEALEKAISHTNGVYIELISGEYDYGDALGYLNSRLHEMYN